MISYQWDAQERMLKLRDELRKEGYKVWMDVEKMGKIESEMEASENACLNYGWQHHGQLPQQHIKGLLTAHNSQLAKLKKYIRNMSLP